MAAEADRLAGAGAVHDQAGDAALHQVGNAPQVLELLGDIKAVEKENAGRPLRAGVLRRHEIAGKVPALEGDLHDLDPHVAQGRMAVEAVDARAEDVEGRLVLRGAEPLGHLVVLAGAEVGVRRGDGVARFFEPLRMSAHAVGDRDAGVEPRLVVVGRLVLQHAADLVELADFGGAVGGQAHHVEECRRPAVISGEVHEVRRFFGHEISPLAFLMRFWSAGISASPI